MLLISILWVQNGVGARHQLAVTEACSLGALSSWALEIKLAGSSELSATRTERSCVPTDEKRPERSLVALCLGHRLC